MGIGGEGTKRSDAPGMAHTGWRRSLMGIELCKTTMYCGVTSGTSIGKGDVCLICLRSGFDVKGHSAEMNVVAAYLGCLKFPNLVCQATLYSDAIGTTRKNS